MSIPCTYPSATDARKAGWFSRRHQSADAHRLEQEREQRRRDEKYNRECAQHTETATYIASLKGL